MSDRLYNFKCLEGEDLSFDDLHVISYCYGPKLIPLDPITCHNLKQACPKSPLLDILVQYRPLRICTNIRYPLIKPATLALQVVYVFSIVVTYLINSPYPYEWPSQLESTTPYNYGYLQSELLKFNRKDG